MPRELTTFEWLISKVTNSKELIEISPKDKNLITIDAETKILDTAFTQEGG